MEGRQVLVTWLLSPGTGQGTSCYKQKEKKKFCLQNCSSGLASFMDKLWFDCREKLPLPDADDAEWWQKALCGQVFLKGWYGFLSDHRSGLGTVLAAVAVVFFCEF